MQIGDYKTTIRGLVSEHVSEVMIGIDWKTANKVMWDFASKQITIAGKSFKLKSKPQDTQMIRRITLQENVIVPARSEANLLTKIVCRSLHDLPNDKLQWSTQPTELQEGMYVSGTLIPKDRYRDVPVRAVNITSQPVHLRAGKEVTQAHLVTELGPFEGSNTIAEETSAVENISGKDELVPEFIEKLMKDPRP